jgi:hypothetical protein
MIASLGEHAAASGSAPLGTDMRRCNNAQRR